MNHYKTALIVGLASLLVSGVGNAEVNKTGAWPEHDKLVTLDLDHVSRGLAVKKLAEQAGWSVVLRAPDTTPVDVHVKDADPAKVLAVLLDDQSFVAERDGDLITIAVSKADAAPPVAPPSSPPSSASISPPISIATIPAIMSPPPSPTTRGEDRTVHGGELVVGPNEVVHDLSVMGGELELDGTATGNLTVMGGTAHLKAGSHVVGNVTTMGGEVEIDEGATVDGRIGSLGGEVKRGDKVVSSGYTLDDRDKPRGEQNIFQRIGSAITAAAMLFVFGAVLLALASRRMETLRVEAGARPMRSFALGFVGILGALVTTVALCVTVVGIPVAFVFLLTAVFASYAGIAAVLTTVGKALIGHKTDSPYLQLAFGCLLFLLSGAIPVVGGIITFVVAMTGVGVVVATRAAGWWPKKGSNVDQGPYRTIAT